MMEPCSHRFTAAEGGARLATTATAVNTLVTECGGFIATRLIHEEAYSVRGLLSAGRQRSVHVSRAANVKADAYELGVLTDLKVAEATTFEEVADWRQELEVKEVLICTSQVFKRILEEGILEMRQVNILVIDSCHTIYKDDNLQYIMQTYKQSDERTRPRILAITYPLFDSVKPNRTAEKADGQTDNPNETPTESTALALAHVTSVPRDPPHVTSVPRDPEASPDAKQLGVLQNLDDFGMYEKLEYKIEELENALCCKMDLAEDIDGCKRISGPITKPKEILLEYQTDVPPGDLSPDYILVEGYMRTSVGEVVAFLEDHRHDPTEIYGDEMYDEFKNIPNPTLEPRQIMKEFLYILEELGPYAADKAAVSLLIRLEKLKIKVPYERHFLLLRLCTTTFVKVRCFSESIFVAHDDWDKVRLFSTPKLLRLIEILEKFTPPDLKASIEDGTYVRIDRRNDFDNIAEIDQNNDQKYGGHKNHSHKRDKKGGACTSKMINDLDNCDFNALGDKIEDRVNTLRGDLKDLDLNCENAKRVQDQLASMKAQCSSVPSLGANRRGGRARARRPPRATSQHAGDALCALVFVNEPFMAKVLFNCIVEVSRTRPAISYINSQYCAVESCGESKDSQKHGRRQEEVLKKFRMHECNLLLSTSALEEGIDLPRCNLVLRWDVPPSYRSYVLCRSRARAVRSGSALLVANSHTDDMLHCLATYKELDQMITRKCGCGVQNEPSPEEETHADTYNSIIAPYTPAPQPCVCRQRAKFDVSALTRTISDSENDICDVNRNVNDNDKSVRFEGSAKINDISDVMNNDLNKKVDEISDVFDIEFNIDEKSDKCDDDSETLIENNMELDENHAKFDTNHTTVNGYNIKMDENEITDDIEKTSRECDTTSNKNKLNVGNKIELDNECVDNGNDAENSESDAKNSDKLNVNGKSDNCLCKCKNDSSNVASVDLNSAIALINRYCAKLPSDTFTRLAPQWWIERVRIPDETRDAFICTLRLPLNCPVKYNIVGHPMPTRVLARRMVALQACRILHKSGELDNQLLPIGKENFKAIELENAHPVPDVCEDSARPGTTKRRQYYYKRTAWAFTDCQPVIDTSDAELEEKSERNQGKEQGAETHEETAKDTSGRTNRLYSIECTLWCALPERYNTRGRRLHAPQHACQALAVLMARHDPTNLQIPAFPVYTRSGEVRVSVEQVPDADVRMSPTRKRLIKRFMQFVFTEVLRVRRRGMSLDSEGSTRNNYYIVPTIKTTREDGSQKTDIDWAFLEQIYHHTEQPNVIDTHLYPTNGSEGDSSSPIKNPLLKDGEVFSFDADRYREAVVTPWYRNQDQPQFFLVAEICSQLTPESAFPSPSHATFRSYYRAKYRADLTQPDQPLLDVDHTSARLNLLTPRYVNRKGVALPVSSERTRRAKRDRLDQKQILVPELCTVHPFAAPLWFATVALPCVLYRINALLIADEIRRAVAIDVGLGIPKIDENTAPGFQWPALDFGWCLAEVLNADVEKTDKKKNDGENEPITEIQATEPSKMEIANAEDEGIDKEQTINEILQEEQDTLNQDDAESGFEIGTWSNDMASSIPETDDIYDEWSEPLPASLTFCTAANGGANWCDPVQNPKPESSQRAYTVAESDCSYTTSDFDSDDSDFDVDTDTDAESGFGSSKAVNASLGVRIEYKTAHEAEAVDVEVSKQSVPAPQRDSAEEGRDRAAMVDLLIGGEADDQYIQKFRASVETHKEKIKTSGQLVPKDKHIDELLPAAKDNIDQSKMAASEQKLQQIFPYSNKLLQIENGQVSIMSIERNKRDLLSKLEVSLDAEEVKKLNCFYMRDIDIDAPDYVNEKIASIGFDCKEKYLDKGARRAKEYRPYYSERKAQDGKFDFDYQPDLEGHPGPSPSVILQALTMSNANDGINLERLETIGDSFLKFAITAYLYCAHPTVHEGKLSHMRSKQVSNLNLYRLGRSARLGARMIASKFEPHDNWLPPCHKPPPSPHELHKLTQESLRGVTKDVQEATGCYIPYNLITQHSIPDKSIADCVEALIGAYLLECGARGALLFMAWLGISVLPHHTIPVLQGNNKQRSPSSKRQRTESSSSLSSVSDDEFDTEPMGSEPTGSTEPAGSDHRGPVGARKPYQDEDGNWYQIVYGELKAPPSPLLRYIQDPEGELEKMLSGYDALEETLQYRFKDRSLLLQALTHASHQKNTLTDCYQRLEFLGDAILDYLITRHLYEDPRRHSPGALTDLRSALVNNTIFATLAVRHGFHKYFRHMSPGLNEVLMKYVKIQEENGHSISEEHYLIQEDELEQAEDVEVPKALGDLFESIAGAIFLDSGMSLGAVWGSYVRLMGAELEAFSAAAPKSPVRELLEAEPDTAKFSKPERLADGRRVRVCVEVFGRGTFKGVGRNYRIAKGTAARCALRHLRKHRR